MGKQKKRIGRKPKRTQKKSIAQRDILNDETHCESHSTQTSKTIKRRKIPLIDLDNSTYKIDCEKRAQKRSITQQDILNDEIHCESHSTHTSKPIKRRKIALIGRKKKTAKKAPFINIDNLMDEIDCDLDSRIHFKTNKASNPETETIHEKSTQINDSRKNIDNSTEKKIKIYL